VLPGTRSSEQRVVLIRSDKFASQTSSSLRRPNRSPGSTWTRLRGEDALLRAQASADSNELRRRSCFQGWQLLVVLPSFLSREPPANRSPAQIWRDARGACLAGPRRSRSPPLRDLRAILMFFEG